MAFVLIMRHESSGMDWWALLEEMPFNFAIWAPLLVAEIIANVWMSRLDAEQRRSFIEYEAELALRNEVQLREMDAGEECEEDEG